MRRASARRAWAGPCRATSIPALAGPAVPDVTDLTDAEVWAAGPRLPRPRACRSTPTRCSSSAGARAAADDRAAWRAAGPVGAALTHAARGNDVGAARLARAGAGDAGLGRGDPGPRLHRRRARARVLPRRSASSPTRRSLGGGKPREQRVEHRARTCASGSRGEGDARELEAHGSVHGVPDLLGDVDLVALREQPRRHRVADAADELGERLLGAFERLGRRAPAPASGGTSARTGAGGRGRTSGRRRSRCAGGRGHRRRWPRVMAACRPSKPCTNSASSRPSLLPKREYTPIGATPGSSGHGPHGDRVAAALLDQRRGRRRAGSRSRRHSASGCGLARSSCL